MSFVRLVVGWTLPTNNLLNNLQVVGWALPTNDLLNNQQQVLAFVVTLGQRHLQLSGEAWDVLKSLTGTIEAPAGWSTDPKIKNLMRHSQSVISRYRLHSSPHHRPNTQSSQILLKTIEHLF